MCFFLSLTIKAQITVKVNQATVNNTSTYYNNAPIIIPNVTNNVDLQIEIYSQGGESPTSPAELSVYRSSTGSIGNGSEFKMTSQTVYFNTNYNYHTFNNINFNTSDFPPGGGIYIQYKKSSGLIYRSPLVNVVKPTLPPITNNTISGNNAVYYGQGVSLTGSSPSGGNGTFTYIWQKKVGNGTWVDISGATSQNYNTGALTTTTQFRRRVGPSSSSWSSSNEVTVTVNNSLPITNNVISGNQTINEEDISGVLTGTTPSGGSGTNSYKYIWQKKTNITNWEDISGATSLTYNPGILYDTTSYRRIVRSGNAPDNTSNEITINVIPAPLLTNNAISIINGIVTGSQPIGGTGNYTYKWTVYFENEEMELLVLSLTTQSITIPNEVYNLVGMNTKIFRTVISGRQSLGSNLVLITPSTDILNNLISLNGTELTGSLPQGGNGSYSYEWYVYYVSEGEVLDVYPHGNTQNAAIAISSLETRYYRVVKSANKVSYSNTIAYITPQSNKLISSLNVNVYPNPTTEFVNFDIDIANTTHAEIKVYNKSGEKEFNVFKGNLNKGQIIKWNIPNNYSKGIYFYKIYLENQEPKTGKIIYQ